MLEVDREAIARRNTLALVTPTVKTDYHLATPLLATPGEALGESVDLIVVVSEPNMHPIRRRFNLNAVGSCLARRKQREQHGELLAASEDCLARLEAVANKNSPQGL